MNKSSRIRPLRSLCDDFRQDVVDGPFGSELQRKDYIADGLPVLKIQNVKPFAIELKKMDYVSPAKFQELRRHSFRQGDIVMTKLGSPLGASAIIEDLEEGVIVADLVRIRAQQINTRYLCYHLNSQRTSDFINSMQKGTTRPRVTLSVVRDLPIYVPPLVEQQRIVSILDEAFDGIATAKANAQRNLRNARALFESYLHSVLSVQKRGGSTTKLGDACVTASGGTPLKSRKEYYNGGKIPWLLSGEVRQGEVRGASHFITQSGLENSSAKLFPRNTVLIAMYGATAGQVGISRFETATNQAVCGIFPNERFVPEFLFYFMLSRKAELVAQAAGNAQPNISQFKIRNTVVPLLSLPEQREIVGQLDSLTEGTQRLEHLYRQKVAAVDALKMSLLDRAVSGSL